MNPQTAFPLIPFGVRGQLGRKQKFVVGNPYAPRPQSQPAEQFPKPKVAEPELPSKMKMAGNAGKALVRTGVELLKGRAISLTDEEAAKRLSICKKCPFYRPSDERCSKCGCFLSKKTYLRAETCPVGKW